ncbi:uncharacterized protein LOC128714472 [Anopheles marshallii]|uniref:uncharacterized protein LOC128714472 n=1 Tax=Anopheles marshallii TaxID=1521116 RepID=UPI00237C1796|nr:uncharacterized protein LOC128714472 [Anopheles marshallii]
MATKSTSFWAVVVTVMCCVLCVQAGPLPEEHPKDSSSASEEEQGHPLNSLYSPAEYGSTVGSDEATLMGTNSSSNTTKELYVIKAIVYEIGILADVPENETLEEGDEPITHQQVDLSFFSHGGNNTHLDLGDIPVPIQTSVQGQVFTGIAPVHVGTVPTQLSDLLSALPIAGTVVNISQTNSSYVEVHKHNITDAAILLNSKQGLNSLPFGSSVSQPLVPASVDETVIGLTTKTKQPSGSADDGEKKHE